MIKRIIKGIVLAVFFAGALLISNYVMNRGTDDKIMTMGEPTLPVVFFYREWSGDQSSVRVCRPDGCHCHA